jgi:hypothetical protein
MQPPKLVYEFIKQYILHEVIIKSLTHSLTHSIEHSFSWEANIQSVIQEIPHLSWNPKFHYRVHCSSPPVRKLHHMNPFHTLPLSFPKIHSSNTSYTSYNEHIRHECHITTNLLRLHLSDFSTFQEECCSPKVYMAKLWKCIVPFQL